MAPDFSALVAHFTMLSLMAVGGVNAVMPEIHRYVVESHGWLTSGQFAAFYAISQAAPGPNALVVTLIGLQISGLPGAFGVTLGMYGPSSILAYQVGGWAERYAHTRWLKAVRSGLAPITVGLVLSSGFILARAVDSSWHGIALTAVTVLLMLRTTLNPLWLIGAGALFGLII